jgi:hypothetical protein
MTDYQTWRAEVDRRQAKWDQRLKCEAAGRDKRNARAVRDDARGRSPAEVATLRQAAARSASCCGNCFRPLKPTDTVSLGNRQYDNPEAGKPLFGFRQKARLDVTVPICLDCDLDMIDQPSFIRLRGYSHRRGVHYRDPEWRRTHCAGCGRGMRIRGSWRDTLTNRVCCGDCFRTSHNRRQNLRRRVRHELIVCAECGTLFLPRRSDAVVCSDKCRHAAWRRRKAGGTG